MYRQNQDLINIGAYPAGTNSAIDVHASSSMSLSKPFCNSPPARALPPRKAGRCSARSWPRRRRPSPLPPA